MRNTKSGFLDDFPQLGSVNYGYGYGYSYGYGYGYADLGIQAEINQLIQNATTQVTVTGQRSGVWANMTRAQYVAHAKKMLTDIINNPVLQSGHPDIINRAKTLLASI